MKEKMSNTSGTKENNKNANNTTGKENSKKFTGSNQSLNGKIFEVTSKDAVHQFAETLRAIADYVGQEYTHGGDIRYMEENLDEYKFIRPANLDPNAHQYDIESWKKQLDFYWKYRGIYKDNKMKLYSLI